MIDMLQKSWKDFKSPKMIALNIFPVLFGVICWGVILFYFSQPLLQNLIQQILPISWQNQLLIKDSLVTDIMRWAINLVIYAILCFFVVFFALIGNVFVSIFYTPIVVRYLRSKYYCNFPKYPSITLIEHIQGFFKMFVLFCAAFVVCALVFLFVPFLSVPIMLIPHFLFFSNAMLFDVASEVLGKGGYENILKQKYNGKFRVSILAYALGFIPFFNFFAPLLQVIIFSHFCFEKQLTLESSNTKNIKNF